MSTIENTVNDLATFELLLGIEEICDGLPQGIEETKIHITQALQTIKAKIVSFSACHPQQLQKKVDIELNSSEGPVDGSKIELSLLSGENFECPFGQPQDDIKDSLIHFSIVFYGKDEESAVNLHNKINTVLIPIVLENSHFKQYDETFKKIVCRRVGIKVYLVLYREMPESLKELAGLAADLFFGNQDGVSIGNILKVSTAAKLTDLMHLSIADFLFKLFKLNIDFKGNFNNIDYFLDYFIELIEQAMKSNVYGTSYENTDSRDGVMVFHALKIIKSLHTNVNLKHLGEMIMQKDLNPTKYEENIKFAETEKNELLEDFKEFRDKLISWGLKEYMDYIDFDKVEIHIVHTAMMLGFNVMVDLPGFNQLVN